MGRTILVEDGTRKVTPLEYGLEYVETKLWNKVCCCWLALANVH